MSENKTNNNDKKEVRGSRTSFLIVCVIAIALAIAVVVMGLYMGGVIGRKDNASSASGSSASESKAISSSAGSSSSASSSKASSSASSDKSSQASSSQASVPPMDEGGQDKAYAEITPVIVFISKTAQPGTMGADEKIMMCATRLLDTLYSSKCSAADFREAGLSYKEENGISNDLREQLYSVLKVAISFSDEATAKKALSGTGIESKCPWDDKTFEKLLSLASGLGFDTASLVR